MTAHYLIERMFSPTGAPVKEPKERPGTRPATPSKPDPSTPSKPSKPWRGPRVDPSVKPRPKARKEFR